MHVLVLENSSRKNIELFLLLLIDFLTTRASKAFVCICQQQQQQQQQQYNCMVKINS